MGLWVLDVRWVLTSVVIHLKLKKKISLVFILKYSTRHLLNFPSNTASTVATKWQRDNNNGKGTSISMFKFNSARIMGLITKDVLYSVRLMIISF